MPWKKLRTSQGVRRLSRLPDAGEHPPRSPQFCASEEHVRALEQRDQLTEAILVKVKTNPGLVSDEATRKQIEQVLSLDAWLNQSAPARPATSRLRRRFARVIPLIVLGVAIVAVVAIASFPNLVDRYW